MGVERVSNTIAREGAGPRAHTGEGVIGEVRSSVVHCHSRPSH